MKNWQPVTVLRATEEKELAGSVYQIPKQHYRNTMTVAYE